MRIGFIGVGNVIKVMGRQLLNASHTIVVCNSRGPETLARLIKELGPGASAETKDRVVQGDIVVIVDIPGMGQGRARIDHRLRGTLADEV
jgi:8-hydroxy-5-deazaflavin:NADPH oxidoreductase